MISILLFTGCNQPVEFNELTKGEHNVNISLPHKKVLLISIQGARGAVMETSDIPYIKGLLPHSIYSWDAVCDTSSTDQAGWASLYTGVKGDKSNVLGASYINNNFDRYPTFFSRIEGEKSLNMIQINDVPTLNDTLWAGLQSVVSIDVKDDEAVKDSAVNRLKTGNPDLLAVSFHEVNEAGKQNGFDSGSHAYIQAIEQIDSYVGEMLRALKSRVNYNREDWLIILTSNHGGKDDGSYGGNSLEERNGFVIYNNTHFSSREVKIPLVNVPYAGTFPFFYRKNGSDHAAYTDNPVYHFGDAQDFTVEFNIRTTNNSKDDHGIIGNKDWSSGSNIGWMIYKQYGNIRLNYRGADASRHDVRDGPFVADGKWHHITVTFNRQKEIIFYENGKFYEAGPTIKGDGNIVSGLPLGIGSDATLDYGYYGDNATGDNYIAGIRVWNTVLDPETIAKWSFIPVTKAHPYYDNLIGYWKANNGHDGDQVIKDYSPEKADLTILNGLEWDRIDDVLNPSAIDPTTSVPHAVDVSVNIMAWLGVKILPEWELDGSLWIIQ